MTIDDIESIGSKLSDCSILVNGSPSWFRLRFQHPDKKLYTVCSPRVTATSTSQEIFDHPWNRCCWWLKDEDLPYGGWEALDEVNIFDSLYTVLQSFRDKLNVFEKKVLEYKMLPSISVKQADTLANMRADLCVSKKERGGNSTDCGPCLLAFKAVGCPNNYILYTEVGTRFMVSSYLGNVPLDASYSLMIGDCTHRGHRYQFVSDTGLLIMKETLGLDHLEATLDDMVFQFSELRCKQVSK